MAVLVTLTGCVHYRVPERTVEERNLPSDFALYASVPEEIDRWWEAFDSPDLNALIARALRDNLSLQESSARMRQAFALARVRRSTKFPQIDAGFGADVGETSRGGTTTGSESYDIGVSAGYEVDLWGRIEAGQEAALLDATASQEDLFSAMLSLSGRITQVWLDIILVEKQLIVTRQQIKINQQSLELNELRFSRGLANALDVFQQRQVVARTESLIPPLEAGSSLLKQELAVLLGKAPRTALEIGETTYPTFSALPAYGIPADLLAQRPDVRAAGLRLQAADWRVSAARADRLPSLNLQSAFSFSGDNVDVVFDTWMATLTSSVTGPIFDAGRRRAEVDRTRAVVDERLSRYRLSVLTAIQEVENALVRIDYQEAFIESLQKRHEVAKKTHTEALNRYRKGLVDYLPVLTALLDLQSLERNLIDADHDNLTYRVQLYLALGGDWMRTAQTEDEKDPTDGN